MSQRSKTPGDLAGRCPRCWQLQPHCLCEGIPRLETRVRFTVLRHAKERWRTTNTARIAALALPSVEIVDYGTPDQSPLRAETLPTDAYLLFPGPSAPAPREGPDASAVHVLVPDGNWHQAGRLARRLARTPGLGLRPLALPDAERATHTLRRARHPHQLSTIEAMAACLELFDEASAAAQLRVVYERLVRASVAGRGGRNTELLGALPRP